MHGNELQVAISTLHFHVQDACKQGSPDLALSLLKVGCTMPALRGLPLGAALLESLVVSVMKGQHCTPLEDWPRLSGPGDNHPGRRSSYTEQTLAAAVETSAPSGTVSRCPHAPLLTPSALQTDHCKFVECASRGARKTMVTKREMGTR